MTGLLFFLPFPNQWWEQEAQPHRSGGGDLDWFEWALLIDILESRGTPKNGDLKGKVGSAVLCSYSLSLKQWLQILETASHSVTHSAVALSTGGHSSLLGFIFATQAPQQSLPE